MSGASEERLRALTTENLCALDAVLSFLERRNIRLYRISSNLIPFASHPVNRLKWWTEFAVPLRRLGERIKAIGVRVSTHPGQYTVLNSPAPQVVRAAVAELVYHARLLDALDTGPGCKVVVHLGGLYGGSERDAIDRFCDNAGRLPVEVRQRLVIENDDRLFDASEVLGAAHAVGVPVVFDWLHHLANPCRDPISDVLPQIFATWKPADGRPKVHLSSQARGARAGAHADFVRVRDALALFSVTPPTAFDCMLEAKQKDRALLRLRRQLAERGVAERDISENRPGLARGSP